jgi:Uma2 family endonuclease
VAAIPFKVELNEKGAIEVSPPTIRHAFVQIGMRLPDVVWASRERMERHRNEDWFHVAPELCVEVLSPTNTRAQMTE